MPAGDGQTNRESLTENNVAGPLARASSVRPRSAPGTVQKRSHSAERYLRYINSEAWKKRRKRYFADYERRCAFCGSRRDIELHHHTYERMGHELDDDLVALCNAHHAEAHSRTTLTQATRAVAAQYGVKIIRRRPRTVLTKKQRRRASKARREEQLAAQRANWSAEQWAKYEAKQALRATRRERRAAERAAARAATEINQNREDLPNAP